MPIQIDRPHSTGPLVIAGALTLHTAEELLEALRQQLASDADVVLDLSGVEECDLSGLQLLCSARKSAAATGKSWTANGTPAISSMCEALGIAPESVSVRSERSV